MPLVGTVSKLGCTMAECFLRRRSPPCAQKYTPHLKWMLLRGKTDVREIGSHHGAPGKSAVLNDLPVVRFRQSPARNFPNAVALCAEHWDQMREHQILGAHS